MLQRSLFLLVMLSLLVLSTAARDAAASGQSQSGTGLSVLAVETFLADIAQNVAGERIKVAALLPIGADPHAFQPTPADVARVAACNVLIVHGGGIEEFLEEVLRNAGGAPRIIVASAGLEGRSRKQGDTTGAASKHGDHEAAHTDERSPPGRHEHHHETDPHFWLSPVHVVTYVTNIRDGLIAADPAGAAAYTASAAAYSARLHELDGWIADQVKQIPARKRLLVTNHESLGYFADRYGFKIIGTILPGASSGASPSAKELARLTRKIRTTGAGAIFLETGSNPQLAKQLAKETGIQVVTEIYTHSVTAPGGPGPTYVEMMRYNTTAIVNALK
jgi:ABC-type Zn uptake system ZnuABC Zn-binding protein ZnuA